MLRNKERREFEEKAKKEIERNIEEESKEEKEKEEEEVDYGVYISDPIDREKAKIELTRLLRNKERREHKEKAKGKAKEKAEARKIVEAREKAGEEQEASGGNFQDSKKRKRGEGSW